MPNWQKGFGVALMGMGDQMSVNYNNSKDEARAIAAEDRKYQTSMRKEQELHNLGVQREGKARNDQADAMEASGEYSPEEIAGVRSGSGLSMAAQREGKVADATAMAEAKGTVETEAQMNELRKLYPDKTDEEIYAIKKQKMDESQMTAAEKNERKVMEIMGDKELKDLSDADKTRLSLYGVKIPGATPVKLTPAVMESVRKSSRDEAKEIYSADVMDDAAVINAANRAIKEDGGTGSLPEGADLTAVRQRLIERKAAQGYIIGINTLTGQFPTETTDGQEITENDIASASANLVTVSPQGVIGSPSKPTAEGPAGGVSVMGQGGPAGQALAGTVPAQPGLMAETEPNWDNPGAGPAEPPMAAPVRRKPTALQGRPTRGAQDVIDRMSGGF